MMMVSWMGEVGVAGRRAHRPSCAMGCILLSSRCGARGGRSGCTAQGFYVACAGTCRAAPVWRVVRRWRSVRLATDAHDVHVALRPGWPEPLRADGGCAGTNGAPAGRARVFASAAGDNSADGVGSWCHQRHDGCALHLPSSRVPKLPSVAGSTAGRTRQEGCHGGSCVFVWSHFTSRLVFQSWLCEPAKRRSFGCGLCTRSLRRG